LADETGEIEKQGEGIANDGCFVSIGQAEEGGSLEVSAGLDSIPQCFLVDEGANLKLSGFRTG
jgi:hypothetical protein